MRFAAVLHHRSKPPAEKCSHILQHHSTAANMAAHLFFCRRIAFLSRLHVTDACSWSNPNPLLQGSRYVLNAPGCIFGMGERHRSQHRRIERLERVMILLIAMMRCDMI